MGAQTVLARAAIVYAQRYSLPVFPCYSPGGGPTGCDCNDPACDNQAKHPRTEHGLSDATTDPDRIKRWWLTWPHANVALATDPRAGIIALDDDPQHGGDETKEALETLHGPLPHTPTVLTGSGGEHLYFRYPDGIVIRNSAGKVGPGLDVRAAGGYVIGPPSVHASGRAYEWAADAHLADVPLAPMPDWLIALATATPTGNGTGEFVVDAVVGQFDRSEFSSSPTSSASDQR